jgi:hydroxymethylpyrimidine/phosphomethylpyrimidine kinase
MKKYRQVLTIAGSDSGGGAGIQADLKTFSAFGCYGMSAITAITAQNTCGVTAIHQIPDAIVAAQIRAVVDDIGVDAVKIGMLSSPSIIKVVAEQLQSCGNNNIVIDPVMVATSGDTLLQDDAISALKEILIPCAKVITPNIPEAEVLTEGTIETRGELLQAAEILLGLGPQAVLVKGGHLRMEDSPDCLLIRGKKPVWLEADRIETKNTHGTGCTLSSAIAASLASGHDLEQSVQKAKEYITLAIKAGKDYVIGHGHGPVKHFHKFWRD